MKTFPLFVVVVDDDEMEDDLLFEFFSTTVGDCCSRNLLVLLAFSRLLMIKMFKVISRVNGQKEYLNESNHVKYFKNFD